MKIKPAKWFAAVNRGGFIFDASPWRGVVLNRTKALEGIKYGCKIIPVHITPITIRRPHAKREK